MALKKRFQAEAGSQKSRKELRKQQRILKKVKKNDHFMKKHVKGNQNASANVTVADTDPDSSAKATKKCSRAETVGKSLVKRIHAASQQKQARMDKRKLSEKKSRSASLKEANMEEDKTIHQLEVLMKMNKRKKAGKLPKIFEDDGLDYILDVTDSDKVNQMNPEAPLYEEDDDDMFEEDLNRVAKGVGSELDHVENWHSKPRNANIGEKDVKDENDDSMSSDDSVVADSNDSDGAEGVSASDANIEDEVSSSNEDRGDAPVELSSKNLRVSEGTKVTFESDLPKIDDNGNTDTKKKKSSSGKATAVWEDIYGRLRDPSGNVLSQKDAGRYVPPALRARQMALSADRKEALVVLRRRLQGQLNRLSASTLRPILSLVSDLYGQHSRHDVSDTLTQLIHQSCVSSASVSSQRIVAEHTLLLAALHCSVGSEVGAHFLQKTALRFNCLLESSSTDDEDNKELDNLLMLLCYLYCLRVTDHLVVSDILGSLTDSFSARDVRLMLVALCCVGFHMRKQQPLLLKQHIVAIQQRATQALSNTTSEDMQSRVRFMLDSLLAIRNNNVAKLPQYDAQLQLHMQQLLSNSVRDDPAANQLSICLQDLLNSEERGKWWVVGSAWSGQLKERRDAASADPVLDQENDQQGLQRQLYSAELLRLAAQQRMNTDLRRNVFCVLMSAEDYVDCHERLLRLGLRGPQQLQEMTAVVLECALRETHYNPYYSHLLELLCSSNRRFQMYVRVAVWERLGDSSRLTETASLSSNLAHILSHLIRSGQLTIAVLKVLEFSELDRPLVRLLRQLLLSLMMLDEDAEGLRLVFSKATGASLKALRDSLVLFLYHFILRKRQKLLTADKVELLESRVQLAVTCLRTSTAELTF